MIVIVTKSKSLPRKDYSGPTRGIVPLTLNKIKELERTIPKLVAQTREQITCNVFATAADFWSQDMALRGGLITEEEFDSSTETRLKGRFPPPSTPLSPEDKEHFADLSASLAISRNLYSSYGLAGLYFFAETATEVVQGPVKEDLRRRMEVLATNVVSLDLPDVRGLKTLRDVESVFTRYRKMAYEEGLHAGELQPQQDHGSWVSKKDNNTSDTRDAKAETTKRRLDRGGDFRSVQGFVEAPIHEAFTELVGRNTKKVIKEMITQYVYANVSPKRAKELKAAVEEIESQLAARKRRPKQQTIENVVRGIGLPKPKR